MVACPPLYLNNNLLRLFANDRPGAYFLLEKSWFVSLNVGKFWLLDKRHESVEDRLFVNKLPRISLYLDDLIESLLCKLDYLNPLLDCYLWYDWR